MSAGLNARNLSQMNARAYGKLHFKLIHRDTYTYPINEEREKYFIKLILGHSQEPNK